jgi:hypothetical protein
MKLGRKPPVHNRRTMRAALAMARALDALGSPPAASADYVSAVNKQTGGNWGMDGNDALGDCTIADCAHQIMLHTANAGRIVIPSTQDCIAAYSAAAGYDPNAALVNGQNPTDQGADETAICQFMMTTGICGQTSAGTGMVDPTNLDHVRWTVQLFGACRLGIIVGQDFIDAFSAGKSWTAPTTDPNAGGHDVPVVKYDAECAYVVTWGGLQAVAWELMANSAFLDEAHAEVYPDWVTASGNAPSGFPLAQLLADLAEVETTS